MVFSSPVFIFLFLPIVFILNLGISKRYSNLLLLVFSLLFYAWGEPLYVFLMIFSGLINYLLALSMDQATQSRKAFLTLTIIFNIGILGVFKYADFVVVSFNQLFNLSISSFDLPLPIGISFYTFQTLSYIIDVYRKQTSAQKNYFSLLLYITFFPQLIAGPIVQYRDIAAQIQNRTVDIDNTAFGLRRFIFGLAKKVLIANTMAVIVDSLFALPNSDISTSIAWLAAIAYLFQIYFDFSGYSDMAIGLGRMFGFHFKENFNYPYIATSIQDFWRRWHISLSSWFKLYVYIPLGGSRQGKTKAIRNRMIIFFLTGLWHGAAWTFVVWGLYHGLFLLLEQTLFKVKLWPKVLQHTYTLGIVLVGFVIFRAETFTQSLTFIQAMFSLKSSSLLASSQLMTLINPYTMLMFLVSIIAATPIAHWLKTKMTNSFSNSLSYGIACIFWILSILSLAANTYNPFIYFRF